MTTKLKIYETIRNLLIVVALILYGIELDGSYHLYKENITSNYFSAAVVIAALLNLYIAKHKAKSNHSK
jgi:hypothetical protein